MKLAIASDHGGYPLKAVLIPYLREQGLENDLSPTRHLYAADGVHPNEDGTQLAAEVLAETILTHKEFTP